MNWQTFNQIMKLFLKTQLIDEMKTFVMYVLVKIFLKLKLKKR
jgi:hypothetical protein